MHFAQFIVDALASEFDIKHDFGEERVGSYVSVGLKNKIDNLASIGLSRDNDAIWVESWLRAPRLDTTLPLSDPECFEKMNEFLRKIMRETVESKLPLLR